MLFDPASHEPLTERAWDERPVRAAIATIASDAHDAFNEESLWPAHPLDLADGPLPRVASLYLGASGVIWALHTLQHAGAAELSRDWADVAVRLAEEYPTRPDFPELVDGPVPSLLMGEAGILLVAHTLAPAAWHEERLLSAARANVANPTLELMWGSPGTMLAAEVMVGRTGEEHWAEAWRASADHLWETWHDDVWEQDLYASRSRYLGPAHGFVGNVFALAHGGLLDPTRLTELARRTIATISKHATHQDGLAQWPPLSASRAGKPQPIRTQWCHGAPGIVASLAKLAPHNDELTALLIAGGELTWHAGPLRKGANLCHGTAGNGYAFLKLFERTGDEIWLTRARAFAMHSIEQVEQQKAKNGRGRYTLWTGDPGTALYLHSCVTATTDFPTLDYF